MTENRVTDIFQHFFSANWKLQLSSTDVSGEKETASDVINSLQMLRFASPDPHHTSRGAATVGLGLGMFAGSGKIDPLPFQSSFGWSSWGYHR